MAEFVNRADLSGVKVDVLDSGSFAVQVRCAICREIVRLHISASDAEMGREVAADCLSGKDWPRLFELHARHSPSETDAEDGMDIWGLIHEREN